KGLFAHLNKDDKKYIKDRLALLDMGLEERTGSLMGLLSGGQRQAITLLMATLTIPKLLLLDEHTAALDPVTAEKVLSLTEDIVNKNKISTLMITHNMADALRLGNRLIMMKDGSIVLDISGEEKKGYTVEKLLKKFKENTGEALDNDRILL
ncbi:MAG: ATP-binding cassette domain-containing protein, partial [Solobacterium sp.]|nr:ATP-binding cassette domain-containing protein [Solobacterium sp.]